MKSGKLTIGNRSIKPAKKIDETHATPTAPKKEERHYKKRDKNIINPLKKEESKTTSIRFKDSEFEKINKYLDENEMRFADLIRNCLKEKGIL